MANQDYNKFSTMLSKKRVLYIPIVSCINRKTNEYNLSCDGNVNRFITTFSRCLSFKEMTIVLPSKHVEHSDDFIYKFANNNNVEIVYSEHFGIHAGEQRNDDKIVEKMFKFISKLKLDSYDLIIFESQKLGKRIGDLYGFDKLVFWNPVSKTTKTRIFLEGYDEINKELIDKCAATIVASPEQVEFYEYNEKLLYLNELIDRSLPYFGYTVDDEITQRIDNCDKPIVFLPYRLTDEGYQFDKVVKFIKDKYDNDCEVWYTDPNNSGFIDEFKEKNPDANIHFVLVGTDRNTYYTILDFGKVDIPYFEDIAFINHAAIYEFAYKDSICNVYVTEESKNAYIITDRCKRFKVVNV